MARNKTNPGTARKVREARVPLIVRYLPVAIAMMTDRIIGGDEAGAKEIRAEISEQLCLAFRGVALLAMETLINREWKLAQNFASPHVIDTAFDQGDLFTASRVHDDLPADKFIDLTNE